MLNVLNAEAGKYFERVSEDDYLELLRKNGFSSQTPQVHEKLKDYLAKARESLKTQDAGRTKSEKTKSETNSNKE